MNSSGHEDDLDMSDVNETFTCLLYPTNVVNCSWSFLTLEKATQLSVFISICDIDTAVQSLSHSPGERVGSRSLTLSPSRQQQHGRLFAILQFNMSLHDKWTVYTYVYDKDTLVVKPSVQSVQLNTLLIVLISLGIPMILLAVLLLVRYQRVFELLFPPIPCPPPKYIHFLEKDDASSFFHPALSSKAEEEITEVEEAKENPGKTF
ncbi:hypothetical protein F2P81_000938 [Scophthalmus maximus]|uniref:Uncharacterized protein n=1 Tax=Scophthalmus maximus TaxID=52904 RepID=A0A6A4TPT5_SCOMX|nr:hypothetical protein F2P81_000938 [Scophthalmus maximus]